MVLFTCLFIPEISKALNSKNSEEKKDTLHIAAFQKFKPINPLKASSTYSSRVKEIIFDGLIHLNDHLEPVAHLARSWVYDGEEKTWTFYLRRGVKFHDGRELTGEDVVFTFQTMMDHQFPSPSTFIFKEIKEIKGVNRYAIKFELKRNLASFLKTLDSSNIGIFSKHHYLKKNFIEDSYERYIGTGPFRMTSWSEKKMVLESNKEYFLGNPKIKNIQITAYIDREMAWTKFISGNADLFPIFAV